MGFMSLWALNRPLFLILILKIAKLGFDKYFFSKDQKSLEKNLKTIISGKGSFFLEVHVNLVDKNKLPRPEKILVKLKKELMKKINNKWIKKI